MSSTTPWTPDGRRRRIVGFGFDDTKPNAALVASLCGLVSGATGVALDPDAVVDTAARVAATAVASACKLLPPPRCPPPGVPGVAVSSTAADRLQCSFGLSFAHLVALACGDSLASVVDHVVFPASQRQVADVLAWCTAHRVAAVPRGGGTSVTGGGAAAATRGLCGAVCVDLRRLSRVVAVDTTDMVVHAEAGVSGPDLEAELRRHGVTLRFFPQSFPCTTVGGWVATQAGGHFATGATHIGDVVHAVACVTPTGTLSSRCHVPASGAFDVKQVVVASEGAFGVITDVWLRVIPPPTSRAARTVRFATFDAGCDAARAVVQAGLRPSNLRLVCDLEAAGMGLGDGTCAVLLLAFESVAAGRAAADMATALPLCAAAGGEWDAAATGADVSERDAKADAWRASFIQAPMVRDAMVLASGIIMETFESAASWSRLPALVRTVTDGVRRAIERHTGGSGVVTVRLTHVYADGAAPYFTVIAPPPVQRGPQTDADVARRLAASRAAWSSIKATASDLLLAGGGTCTHHHAVGRDHAPWHDREFPGLRRVLAAVKAEVDPAGVMNPGVLGLPPSATPTSRL